MKPLEKSGLSNLLRLNLRVLKLAVTGKWLGKDHYARSYDEAAKDYDSNWLVHLQPVTDELIAAIPDIPEGSIIDLGCGSGYATQALARCFPHRILNAVDISEGMLSEAQKNHGNDRVNWIHADMLDYLACQPMAKTAFIFSAWAIGYSHPGKVIREAARMLKKGGVFAFVVNLSDTLPLVFRTFRRCMLHHPRQVRLAAAPGFPKSGSVLKNALVKNGFQIIHHDEGYQVIEIPSETKVGGLAWLRKTGILAGFDAMLPLSENRKLAEDFERMLKSGNEPMKHHYVIFVGRKNE
ncbi:MAG: methyltransferase domain-containing protein [Desulfobacteraceae bacterium]|jgi:trans-aconitate methyltransferase